MTEEDFRIWRTDPITVAIIARMRGHRDSTIQKYKDDWFAGSPPSEYQLASLNGFDAVVMGIEEITFDDFTELEAAG